MTANKYYNEQGGGEFRVLRAMDEIRQKDGVNVLPSATSRSLVKFGRNDDVGTALETIWIPTGDEVYATGNTIDSFSSTDTGDAGDIVVQGHTISGGILTEVSQTVTLDGQNETLLTTPLARVQRVFNDGTANWLGDVYIYEDDTVVAGVPQTAANIHLQAQAEDNQSHKCAFSTADGEYLIITTFHVSVFKKTASDAEFTLETREIGTTNKTFRIRFGMATSDAAGSIFQNLDPAIIIPPNHDVRVPAAAGNTGTSCFASLHGIYATIVP